MAGHDTEVDAVSGRTTTGHEWDGIKELNTPLPRWWVNVFYATIIWAFGYFFFYPAWPLISDTTRGILGYSSRAEVTAEVAALQTQRAAQAAGLAAAPLDQIRTDATFQRIALAQGRAAFGDNCAPCHGLGGGGRPGFPNLNDDDWIWGGTLDEIHTTLLHGIRVANVNETRISQMPAFGRLGVLKPGDITNVTAFVRSLSGLAARPSADLGEGKRLFGENCASCHGDEGRGNKEFGAPNLTDAIWLYGSDEAAIVDVITNSRNGVMPAWAGRLDPTTIKALTIYVHTLGGGQ